MDTEAAVITLNSEDNTVGRLRDMVSDLYASGAGGGFPILSSDSPDGGDKRIFGYIGLSELDHALGLIGTAEEAEPCSFAPNHFLSASAAPSEFDFGHLVDHAPVTVSVRSPMVYLHQLFVRLGIRYIVVQDERGLYRGLIEKARCARLPFFGPLCAWHIRSPDETGTCATCRGWRSGRRMGAQSRRRRSRYPKELAAQICTVRRPPIESSFRVVPQLRRSVYTRIFCNAALMCTGTQGP